MDVCVWVCFLFTIQRHHHYVRNIRIRCWVWDIFDGETVATEAAPTTATANLNFFFFFGSDYLLISNNTTINYFIFTLFGMRPARPYELGAKWQWEFTTPYMIWCYWWCLQTLNVLASILSTANSVGIGRRVRGYSDIITQQYSLVYDLVFVCLMWS